MAATCRLLGRPLGAHVERPRVDCVSVGASGFWMSARRRSEELMSFADRVRAAAISTAEKVKREAEVHGDIEGASFAYERLAWFEPEIDGGRVASLSTSATITFGTEALENWLSFAIASRSGSLVATNILTRIRCVGSTVIREMTMTLNGGPNDELPAPAGKVKEHVARVFEEFPPEKLRGCRH
jgi:hypothetical protein